MNETDVREIVVRPFLHLLGYEHGTENNIRTEIELRYPFRSLGHKKSTDRLLRGRADYICEVVKCGRWIVEVKSPSQQLSEDDVDQAHSYAVHPEVGATHFVVTNGRHFQIYSVSKVREPLMQWDFSQQQSLWVNIQNLLGPEAVRRRASAHQSSTSKDLAIGVGPRAQLVGGYLEYAEHQYSISIPIPTDPLPTINGFRATVVGDHMYRAEGGQIAAVLRMIGPNPDWDRLNQLAGIEKFLFITPDEYVSTNPDEPTIFQNLVTFSVPEGTSLKGVQGMPSGMTTLPFDFGASAFSQAVGYLADRSFKGVFSIIYTIQFPDHIVALFPEGLQLEIQGYGDFNVRIES